MNGFVRVGLVATTLLLGCSDEREPIPDAGAPIDAAVRESSATVDVSRDAPTPDGTFDPFDVIVLPDSGCPGCILDRCGPQIGGCITNPVCATGLFCTLQMCAGDGGLSPTNFACVLSCFNDDQNAATMAFASLACLTMTCGAVCNLLDAGSDARPPTPDVQSQPDATADVPSQDARADASAPETGSGTDSGGHADGDDATPDGADDEAGGSDVSPETGGQLDTAPPSDVTPDAVPSDEGGDEGGAD